MKPNLKALYQELILEHNKNPIRFYEQEEASKVLEAYNPICGDRFKIFLKLEGDQISEVSFKGYGCAISKASTSVLVQYLQGLNLAEAKTLLATFQQTINTETNDETENSNPDFQVFSAVRSFPGRTKCVLLGWEELERFIETE